MSVVHTVQFDDPAVLPTLQRLTDADLDLLDFGVIGIDGGTVVCRYNAWESRMAGLSPQRVLGHPLFAVVAPCMNNAMVARRFDAAASAGQPLDLTIDYVLSLRMRPVKVKLRLLSQPGEAMHYVLVHRPNAG